MVRNEDEKTKPGQQTRTTGRCASKHTVPANRLGEAEEVQCDLASHDKKTQHEAKFDGGTARWS